MVVVVSWRDLVVIIPSFVLFRLWSTGGLGTDDLVDAQNRAGCFRSEQDGPLLGEKQIVELIQFHIACLVGNVRRLRRGRLNLTDDEAHIGIVMVTNVELSKDFRALHAGVLGKNLRNRLECFGIPLNGVLFDAGTRASVGRQLRCEIDLGCTTSWQEHRIAGQRLEIVHGIVDGAFAIIEQLENSS